MNLKAAYALQRIGIICRTANMQRTIQLIQSVLRFLLTNLKASLKNSKMINRTAEE
jgi:hypothetical protein